MSDKASIRVNVFDGARQPLSGVQYLLRIRDGNIKQVYIHEHSESSVKVNDLQVFNNFGDHYTVVVSASNYIDTGFTPVIVKKDTTRGVNLMLLRKKNRYNFEQAQWAALESSHPELIEIFSAGIGNADARSRYEQMISHRPDSLAALLNITTALQDAFLQGGNGLSFLKALIWDGIDSIAQDRFFGFADKALIDELEMASHSPNRTFQPASGALHPGATRSYKQTQFGEANLQITLHENEEKKIGNVQCIKVEYDIDYFSDPFAHLLLEVLPNIGPGMTNPKLVYMLRWIAGKQAGIPDFEPPYTIEAEAQ